MSFFTNGKSSSPVTSKFNTERAGVYGNIGEIQAVEYQFSEADTLMPDIRVKLTVFVDGLQYPKIIEIASWFSKDNGELSGPGSTFKINRLFEGVGVNLKAEAEGKEIVTIEDYVDFYSSLTNRLLDQKVVWISYVNREWEGKLKYAAHSFVSTVPSDATEEQESSAFSSVLADFNSSYEQGRLQGRNAYRPDLLTSNGDGASVEAQPADEVPDDMPF